MVEIRELPFGSPEQEASVALRREILRTPLGLDYSAEYLREEANDIHLGAFLHDALIGVVLLRPLNDDCVQMRQLAVRVSNQGQGIGTKLIAKAEDVARSRSARQMMLHARITAVPLYRKLGYERVGEPFEEVTIVHFEMRKRLA